MLEIKIHKDDAEQTILKFLCKTFPDIKKSIWFKLFRNKKIIINDIKIKDSKYILSDNDKILIRDNKIELPQRKKPEPVNLQPLNIVYEDDNILIINKPYNFLVNNNFNINNSIDHLVRYYLWKKEPYLFENNLSFKITHLHRIDKATSGILLYAKNKESLNILSKNYKTNIEKQYIAIVEGKWKLKDIFQKGYIYKDINNNKMKCVNKDVNFGKFYEHNIKFIKYTDKGSYLQITLKTGRKHQIRAGLLSLNYSILNDVKYGAKKIYNNIKIELYSYKIIFGNLEEPLNYLSQKEFKIKDNILDNETK